FEEIGWRAGAAALSDLAAEGAQPIGVLVSLGMPGENEKRETGNVDPAAEIMAGVGAVAQSVGARVLGGDLLKSERYLVDVCALGTCERPVRRAGGRPGDGVWVTGELGGCRLALRELQAGRKPADDVARRFARPAPRIAAGLWLARQGARAMLDVSDGLASDARHLAAASGVALEIALEHVPCWIGADPLLAVASGEEYELLVALPPAFGAAEADAFQEFHDLPLTRIGSCAAGEGVRFTDRGLTIAPPRGFDHFAS
ncbi:MAG: thiamine-monophosphate kinase, partial [Gemmatimonadetes bacterium]|nr:thiamine-monophosphate kinase [Gemmatimonadota bacterium]